MVRQFVSVVWASVAASCLLLLTADVVVVPANSLTFAVIGDWGLGGYKAGWFPEIRSANCHNRVCKAMGCNFTLSVGDNIYVGNVVEGLQNSFEEMFDTKQPFFPSLGNHDNAGPQLQYTNTPNTRWKFPAPTYTYTMPIDGTGHTIQIFAVNSNDGGLGGGGQYVWLEAQLKASTARWKIIFGHFPTVGSGRHRRSGSVGRIHQLMKDYNAQAYFAGHDHILEMNNYEGRVLGISGAMARGGMMLRGIGGATRRFTVTHPNEYNKLVADWPAYGIITVRISPNVMNVQLWDQNEAIQYDFSTTHDWMSQVAALPDAAKHQWPPGDVILKAYKDEIKLPPGPGGGQYFSADGNNMETTTTTAAPVNPNAPPTSPATTLPPATVKNDVATDNNAVRSLSNENPLNLFLKYSVTTECVVPCDGHVTMGYPFTVYISGTTVTSSSRIFVTTSPVGCDNKDKADLLPGTEIIGMPRNVVAFNPSKGVPPQEAFICYSGDQGKTYDRVESEASLLGESGFLIRPEDGAATANETQLQQQSDAPTTITAAPAGGVGSTTTAAPTTSSSGGHSTMTVLIVVIVCGISSAVGAVYYVKTQGGGSGGGARRGRSSRRQRYEQLASGSGTDSTSDELEAANQPAPAVRKSSKHPTRSSSSKKRSSSKKNAQNIKSDRDE